MIVYEIPHGRKMAACVKFQHIGYEISLTTGDHLETGRNANICIFANATSSEVLFEIRGNSIEALQKAIEWCELHAS